MTIIIGFNIFNQRDFKAFALDLSFGILLIKGKPTAAEFVDSNTLKVCHKIRVPPTLSVRKYRQPS